MVVQSPPVSLTSACPSGDERVLLFGLLLEVNARLARSLGEVLEGECQLPLAWFDVLVQLKRAPEGRLKMNQVADAIVHSTGGTTRLIDRLEEAGLVERQLCPSDRRATYVALTEKGQARLDQAFAVHLAFLDQTLSERLDSAERADLSRILEKLKLSR
jgi:MarR family 2-MHQ and catechol resistance regulon transcriptional repressor